MPIIELWSIVLLYLLKKSFTASSGLSYSYTRKTRVTKWSMFVRQKKSLRSSDHRFHLPRCASTSNNSSQRTKVTLLQHRKVKTSRRLKRCLTPTLLPSLSCQSTLESVCESFKITRGRTPPCSKWKFRKGNLRVARVKTSSNSKRLAVHEVRFTAVSKLVLSHIWQRLRCLNK